MDSERRYTPESRKPRAHLVFGVGGHEGEYVFYVQGGDVPQDVASAIENELGEEWEVFDRGSRLEIRNRKKFGLQNDEEVFGMVTKALGDQYELHS